MIRMGCEVILGYSRSVFFQWVAVLMFLLVVVPVAAQNTEELRQVRVDELTEDQVRKFAMELGRLNIGTQQMEMMALQRGMNPDEVVKLKARLAMLRNIPVAGERVSVTARDRMNTDSIRSEEMKPLESYQEIFAPLQSRNFGDNVFANGKSTFEPNLRLPSPTNYILAADDELVIDVSGYSEATYRLKVAPEGNIRIPQVGPVMVSGLTLDQAKQRITSRLVSTIYSNIRSGKTRVDITLGAIRSIKVTIIGEAVVPGTYTLPSVATVYNALYACSGINRNGSYRNIQVVRNNKVVATLDIYEYLVNGIRRNDVRLMDNDVIRIRSYELRVELKGEVKRPGIYDVKKEETLERIIQYAGGFTENAYLGRIRVFRNGQKDREISTIKESDLKTLVMKPGDTYIIEKILNRFTNRVNVRGAVYRSGEYELKPGMTLTGLIEEADGVREDAFMNRGIIHRLKDDLSPSILSFDLEKIKSGKMPDIRLQREDRVVIYSKFDLKEGYFVGIEGEVSAPGVFLYEEGMTIQDLILMAGGIKEAATLSRIEVARRVKRNDTALVDSPLTAIIFQKDIRPDFTDSAGTVSLVLEPFDQVTVYRAPGYFEQRNVVVEGEVLFPGRYSLQMKSDRISDLVKRAGGLTKEAYLKGAVLVRKRNFSKGEQTNAEQGLNNLLKQNVSSGASIPYLQDSYEDYIRKKSENVGINLDIILENPGSQYDLLLNDSDTLRIPKELQTVRVNGEVLYPALVRYDMDFKFKDYISGAGGFNERSARKKSYVVNANGSAQATKSFFFIKSYPRVYPGSEIYVPIKRERQRLTTLEGITIGTTLVTLLAILLNVTNR